MAANFLAKFLNIGLRRRYHLFVHGRYYTKIYGQTDASTAHRPCFII